jgi:hypothetical protein
MRPWPISRISLAAAGLGRRSCDGIAGLGLRRRRFGRAGRVTGMGDEIQGALVGSGSGEELKDRLGQCEAEQTAAPSSWRSRPAAHRGPAVRLRHGHTSPRGLSLTGGRRQVRSHYREEESTRHEAAQHGWTLTAARPPGQAPPRFALQLVFPSAHAVPRAERHVGTRGRRGSDRWNHHCTRVTGEKDESVVTRILRFAATDLHSSARGRCEAGRRMRR